MKKIFLIFLTAAGIAAAQTVYEVQPNTKGNEIVLTILNESTVENAGRINVTLQNEPRSLKIKNCGVQIDELKKGEEREAHFSFDVKRIPAAKKDTLHFKITTRNGESWAKEIILSYSLPAEFKLEQNYPNPFNPSTTIEYVIPSKVKESQKIASSQQNGTRNDNAHFTLKVFDILGREVKTLLDGEVEAGYHQVTFNARELASGVYFYTLSGCSFRSTKKMVLLK